MKQISWVVLELSSKGEEEALKGSLKERIVSDTAFVSDDIYIPLMIRKDCEPIWLMEGYIFIKSGYGNSEYYQLKHKHLVKNIVSTYHQSGMFSLGVISDKELKRMIKQVDNLGGSFKQGDEIRIKKGAFSGFEGPVVMTWYQDDIRMYSVHLKFRSVELLLTVDGLSVEGV